MAGRGISAYRSAARLNSTSRLAITLAAASCAVAMSSAAQAGAFLLREQSTEATGLSTAGAAAGGGGLGSMFWNPATITDHAGWQSSWSLTGIFPESKITAGGGSSLLAYGANSGNVSQSAVLPASYSTYQLNDKIWLGLAVNTPFGLVTQSNNIWAGSTLGITSKIESYDFNPTIAYKVNDMLSVAAGVQAMYFKTYLRKAIDLPNLFGAGSPFADASVRGDGWGFGFTLGATLKPVEGTEIGIGYRSSVTEKQKGNINFGQQIILPGPLLVQPLPVGSYPAQLTLKLPDVVTLGLKQRITNDLTLLAGFEWDHWNTVQQLPITSSGGFPPAGTVYETISARFTNGYIVSLGGEYKWNPNLTLRAGVAYEKSPINNSNRLTILPDSDRVWTSIGAGWKVSDKLKLDFSYAHLFGRDGTVNITQANPAPLPATTLVGSSRAHVDLVSVGLTYRWDDPAPRPRDTLIRKY